MIPTARFPAHALSALLEAFPLRQEFWKACNSFRIPRASSRVGYRRLASVHVAALRDSSQYTVANLKVVISEVVEPDPIDFDRLAHLAAW